MIASDVEDWLKQNQLQNQLPPPPCDGSRMDIDCGPPLPPPPTGDGILLMLHTWGQLAVWQAMSTACRFYAGVARPSESPWASGDAGGTTGVQVLRWRTRSEAREAMWAELLAELPWLEDKPGFASESLDKLG